VSLRTHVRKSLRAPVRSLFKAFSGMGGFLNGMMSSPIGGQRNLGFITMLRVQDLLRVVHYNNAITTCEEA
jgi:hypothetical protein